MQTEKEILQELHDTPAELLTPVDTAEFKPFVAVDGELAKSLSSGKEDVVEGQLDDININMPGYEPGPDAAGNADAGYNTPPAPANDDLEFSAAEFITTDMAISLLSFIVIFIGLFFLQKFGNINAKNDDLELTADEKKTLKKPLEKCLETIKAKSVNPWVALIICIVIIYGLKFAAIIMADKEKKKELEEKEKELQLREQKLRLVEDENEYTTPRHPKIYDITPKGENDLGLNLDGTPKKDKRGRKRKINL